LDLFSIDWKTFLSISTVSSLVAFALNQLVSYFTHRRKTRACARILLSEVNRHRYWIAMLQNRDLYALHLFLDHPDQEWEKIKYEMTPINFDKFEVLFNHYEAMRGLRAVAQCDINNKTLIQLPANQVRGWAESAAAAYTLLYSIAKPTITKEQNTEANSQYQQPPQP